MAGEPNATYCDFTYTSSGVPCNCKYFHVVLASGTIYVCVPCPPESSPCTEGSAASWVNSQCGCQTVGSNYANYNTNCGSCAPPPLD